MYAGYSYKLNDSTSESDEVHALELPLLITLSTAQSQLKFLWRG